MSRADDLSRSLDLVRVVSSYGIELQREGAEHVACCPFHQEDTPSFRIYFDKPQNKQRWKCFGCSASGDVIDFVRDIEGLPDSRAAMDRLQAFDATAPLPPPTPKKQQPAMKTKTGKLLATYDYTDEVGELLFQVLRYEVLTETGEVVRGKKTFRQRQPDGNGGWLRNIDGVRRVLYRLPFLISSESVWLCYSPDTEVLTGRGWVEFPNLRDDDMVAQYERDTEEITFVTPLARQKFAYAGEMVNIQAEWCDLLVTPEHRMLTRYQKHGKMLNSVVVPAERVGKNRLLPVSGYLADIEGVSLGEPVARLVSAYVADGRWEPRGNWITWNLKKERKKARLRWLLSANSIPWEEREYPSAPGWTHFIVQKHDAEVLYALAPEKRFSRDALDWDLASRQSFLDEVQYWDGDSTGPRGIRFFTSKKEEADAICAVAACSGWSAMVRTQTRICRDNSGPEYIVNLLRDTTWRTLSGKSTAMEYEGNVYCCTVPSGFIVVRRNGKVTIAGNCEGEKDVHSLEQLGIVATTIPGGARATWDHGYTETLRGKHIVLCCDTDAPGQEHQARCLTHLRDAAASLSICHLPELCKDVTEFIEAGQDPRELVRPWTPPAETPSPPGGPDPDPEPEPEPKPRPRPKRRTAVETTYSDTPPNADWMQHLIRTGTGAPKALLANAITAFRHAPEWQGRLHWNEFGLHVISRGALPWGAGGDGADRVWSDNEDRLAADWLQHHGIAVNPIVAAQAVQTVAHESPFHPVRRYLDFLSWDGEHRIEAWLQYYLGVKHSDLVAAFGSRWLISAVARVMSPGCKADCALVLEGRQGVYKSTAMRALASPWFSDHLPAVDSKDAQVQLAGVWVLELAELDAMKKTEVSAVKSFLSTTIDRYRPPYGTRAIDVPRQCVFVGTTNQDQWLRDETGNRRFWPARCEGRIRLDELARDRDQIWAEAVFRWREGGTWWLDTPELNAAAAEEQAARLARDVWEELIVPWLDDAITPKDRIRISDVLRECVKRDQQQWTRSDEMRVAAILRGLGWTRRNASSSGSDWRYFRP